jgi:hypothetical protein
MNSKTKKFFIVFVVIGIVYLVFAQFLGNRNAVKRFDVFFNSNLKGEIQKIGIKHHGVSLKMNNDENEYVFYPYTSDLNDKNVFNYFANACDSIVKPINTDTLILIKQNKRYKYTFQKFVKKKQH